MISKILTAPAYGSYYYEDVSSLQSLPVPESDRWFAMASTPGFSKVRELAETISLGLSDGERVAWGDCVGVSYAGKSGRKELFRHESGLKAINTIVAPWLKGRKIRSLREFGAEWAEFTAGLSESLHPAIGYGLSQSILSYLAPHGDLYRVIGQEWGLPTADLKSLELQGSCGNNRYDNADKMIVRRIAAFPQSQVDDIKTQVGEDGRVLLDYARWLAARVAQFNLPDYRPMITLDVHGAIGKVFHHDVVKISDFLRRIEEIVYPLTFRIESPALADSVDAQIDLYASIRRQLSDAGSKVELSADEWANTKNDIQKFADAGCVDWIHIKSPDLGSIVDVVDAVLYCKSAGTKVLLGGSCVETDLSTRATIHLGMASCPDLLLVKLGMGFDEGYMLCQGEMARIQALSVI